MAGALNLGSELDQATSQLQSTHKEISLTTYIASKVRRGIQSSKHHLEYKKFEHLFYLLLLVTISTKIITATISFSNMTNILSANLVASQVSIVSIPFGFIFKETSKYLVQKTLNLSRESVLNASFYKKDEYVFAASRLRLLIPLIAKTFKDEQFSIMNKSRLTVN